MLQEHGISRPSVFELLAHVHTLRGTKSRFQYTIPVPQPLSPRQQSQFKPSSSPNNPEGVVSSSGQPNMFNARISGAIASSALPSKNQGVQAREKVLEAIAPMRRGRPTVSKESVSSSGPEASQKQAGLPGGDVGKRKPWANDDFVAEDNNAWKTVTSTTLTSGKDRSEDAWKIGGEDLVLSHEKKEKGQGFGDDFAENLWDSFDPTTTSGTPRKTNHEFSTTSRIPAMNPRAHALTGPDARPYSLKDKDAFAGLGLGTATEKPAPTLGEARKLRTGLAAMNANTNGFRYDRDRVGGSSSRLTPSPRPPYSPPNIQPQSQSLTSPPFLNSTGSGSSWRTSPQPSARNLSSQFDGLPAESRFPSLEELDATFSPPSTDGTSSNTKSTSKQAENSPLHRRNSNFGYGPNLLKPGPQSRGSYGQDGVRSEQVTGVAMRESRGGNNGRSNEKSGGAAEGVKLVDVKLASERPSDHPKLISRPTLSRKHRSSVTMKHASHPSAGEGGSISTSPPPSTAQNLAPPSSRLPTSRSKDWLTGDNDNPSTSSITSLPRAETPVLRDSPSKRASFIQKSDVPIPNAVTALHDHVPSRRRTPTPPRPGPAEVSPTLSRFTRNFPPIDTTDGFKDDAIGALTENWSPVATRTPGKPREIESSSSADEGPEDAVGKTRPIVKVKEDSRRIRRKGRQSSVHDLVDLWGGGVGLKDKEREPHSARLMGNDPEFPPQRQKMRSTVSPLISAKSDPNARSTSPQLLSPPSASAGQQGMSSEHSNKPTSGGPTVSPSPTRSRPQSMFMFPSRSTDGLSLPQTDPGLAPPEDPPQQSRIRRTSISDIVQRYEGISGKPRSTGLGGPPSPGVSRPAGKFGPPLTENGRFSRGQANLEVGKEQRLLPVSSDRNSSSRGLIDTNRASPAPLRTSPIGAPTPLQHDVIRESENPVPRPRRSSFKPEMARPIFPTRKSTEESLVRPADGRSPSPERPYQGVGKLIDQWQRKTAEAEPVRTGAGILRGSFPAKRDPPGRGR